jgi:hypothetical protein
MDILSELVHTALASSARAYLGVSLIFIYMTAIVGTAVFRIYQNFKEDHH